MRLSPFDLVSYQTVFDRILSCLSYSVDPFDANTALLDSKGELINVLGSNPLHFTSFEACAKAVKTYLNLKPSETAIVTDPYSGNTRLCDLMMIQSTPDARYFVAVQVAFPQLLRRNLKKIFTSVEDEGFRIPPTPLEENGVINPALLQYLSESGITIAQLERILGQARLGLTRAAADINGFEKKKGREKLQTAIDDLRKFSETQMRRALHGIPDGDYMAHDSLDNDGIDKDPLRVQARLSVQGENILLSFSGSQKQVKGPYNCTHALTLGACFWVFRSLAGNQIPINSGAFKSFSVEAPVGTIVNARYPSPLLGGYFETTKRIVSCLYLLLSKALPYEIPAMNGGSMSPVLVDFGRLLLVNQLGAGSGASKEVSGKNTVLADLHNTPLMSIEELERSYPIQVLQNTVRSASAGSGKSTGGEGLTRRYKFSAPATVMILSDRHDFRPQGFFGGTSGAPAETQICPAGDKAKPINAKQVHEVSAGDMLVLNTPGGAGWGKPDDESD